MSKLDFESLSEIRIRVINGYTLSGYYYLPESKKQVYVRADGSFTYGIGR